MSGILYGLGVGPGDPELVTLKALKVLERAPVIAYPAPETGDSLARSIAGPHIPEGRTEIVIRTPMVAGNFPAARCTGEPFTRRRPPGTTHPTAPRGGQKAGRRQRG